MGGGDVKLLAMVGGFLGWQIALLTFFIAPMIGAVVGIIIKLKTKSSLIAYGPYLSIASIIALFWNKQIINWVLYRYY
jgi:leader peptidase (prepilin peptidase)/N-methyltransferase